MQCGKLFETGEEYLMDSEKKFLQKDIKLIQQERNQLNIKKE